jgi:hypothetical protein
MPSITVSWCFSLQPHPRERLFPVYDGFPSDYTPLRLTDGVHFFGQPRPREPEFLE